MKQIGRLICLFLKKSQALTFLNFSPNEKNNQHENK